MLQQITYPLGGAGYFGDCGYLSRDWRFEALKIIPRMLSTATCLHVALLVYLRMVTITRPLSYAETHIKLRHISIIVIWVMSIIICVVLAVDLYFHEDEIYIVTRVIFLHGFHTIPFISTIIMYGKLSWTVYRQKSISTSDGRREIINQHNIMVRRIILCLVVCYLPYISMWEYSYSVVGKHCMAYKSEVIQ